MSEQSMVELVARAIAKEYDCLPGGETWDVFEGQFLRVAAPPLPRCRDGNPLGRRQETARKLIYG